MSSLAESLAALPAVVSGPVAYREGVDVLQSPDSLSSHSKGHFLDAEENVSLELGDWLNASKGPWNLKASGKDGCQAYLTYHFLWSEMGFFYSLPHVPEAITLYFMRRLQCCSFFKGCRFLNAVGWVVSRSAMKNNNESGGVWCPEMAHLHDTMILKNYAKSKLKPMSVLGMML